MRSVDETCDIVRNGFEETHRRILKEVSREVGRGEVAGDGRMYKLQGGTAHWSDSAALLVARKARSQPLFALAARSDDPLDLHAQRIDPLVTFDLATSS